MALLKEYGPKLGRPHADTLNDSEHANMKELRFKADGGVWRVTYAFDPKREAILLVAGDKSGVSEKRFYKQLIAKEEVSQQEYDQVAASANAQQAIVASSRAIKDDDIDPPCIRAKREYKAIANDANGSFKCVGEPESNPTTLTFEIGKEGPRLLSKAIGAAIITGTGVIGNQALGHG